MSKFTFAFGVPKSRFDGATIVPRPVSVEARIPLQDRTAYEYFLAGRKVIKAEMVGGRWDGLVAEYDPHSPEDAEPDGEWEEVDTAFANWLAGFIDGEGCFLIKEWRSSYNCALKISLRDDDYAILAEIKRRTGLGLLRSCVRVDSSHNPQTFWFVTRKKECLRLVEILDAHPLRAKKARDFAIWRDAVIEWNRAAPGCKDFDWSRMAALKDELAAGRKYSRRN